MMNKKNKKIYDIKLSKKDKSEVLEYKNRIKRVNKKYVRMIKNPPMEKINKLINMNKLIKDKNKKKSKKENIKNENNLMKDLFVKLETENDENYKIRKLFIENNLPKTKKEYKIIISLSIILVNKIFLEVKYSESIEKVLKEKMNEDLKNKIKRDYAIEL